MKKTFAQFIAGLLMAKRQGPKMPGPGAIRAWERQRRERAHRRGIDMEPVPTRQLRRAAERAERKLKVGQIKAGLMRLKVKGGSAAFTG
jgi:hypothetical protein